MTQSGAMYRPQIIHDLVGRAIASAEGYIEANLTQDRILELSNYVIPAGLPENLRFPTIDEALSYSDFEKWRIDNLIIENIEKYIEISDRNYLIECFKRGKSGLPFLSP